MLTLLLTSCARRSVSGGPSLFGTLATPKPALRGDKVDNNEGS